MYLTLEDLVPNALIELIENDVCRSVSYLTIMQYGNVVIKELEKRNINAIMLIYRDNALQFEDEYKEIFDFYEIDNIGYVKLKDNINTQYLRKHFRTRQSLDTLIALTSDNSKKVLGIDVEEINLKTNYRSTENIINHCNKFVELDNEYQNARVHNKPKIIAPDFDKDKMTSFVKTQFDVIDGKSSKRVVIK